MQVPQYMKGVRLTGHGGLDKLEYRSDLPVPDVGPGEVLIAVKAAGVNNTDINTRIGWYSKAVSSGTNAGGLGGVASINAEDATWSGGALEFPRIQGADCYGEIVAVGKDTPPERVGERVLVRTMLRSPVNFRPFACWTFGSDCDGAFAEYAVAPSADVFRVEGDLSDAELGAIPCAYGTAEGMMVRASVTAADTVLILGASGGVGSAAVQLAKLRGATVIAVAAKEKADAVTALGADRVCARGAPLVEELGSRSVSVIADLVGGSSFRDLPNLLARGGRYATAGAIAGPIATFDLRTMYLNDLTFFGCAAQEDVVFDNLIAYLRDGLVKPRIAATFPLSEIRRAQELFLSKTFVGKIVLLP